jgi:hypothetical protein
VLLVDDDEAEITEVGLILLKGVCANDELCLAAHDSSLRLSLGSGVERSSEQGDFVGLAG